MSEKEEPSSEDNDKVKGYFQPSSSGYIDLHPYVRRLLEWREKFNEHSNRIEKLEAEIAELKNEKCLK